MGISSERVRTVSAVVVAVCAVALTAQVMIFGLPLVVAGQKTYDKTDLESRVFTVLVRRNLPGNIEGVTCPSGVTVKAGVTFDCTVKYGVEDMRVPVTVTDTDSGAFEVGDI